jgi:ribonuclease-3
MDKERPESGRTPPLSSLTKAIGYTFKDKSLLDRARTHRSVHALKNKTQDYEQLEFIGDAVLDLAVAHLLLERHPSMKEGDLSKLRAALVNTQSLAEVGRTIKLGKHLKLSRGEATTGGADRPSILADVVEAILGAVYRDGGFEASLAVVTKLFADLLENVRPVDPKTELQEVMHAIGCSAPVYKLIETRGPEHAPIFLSSVEIDGTEKGRGEGATKKASQQAAALVVLKTLRNQQKK